ncbi:MAG TPA: DUF4190 domain-containing protein [Pyrinomonadaceae bacterium]|nr:DUF4190 domain-containing protein [Pyrinomonadaceae bacterium]
MRPHRGAMILVFGILGFVFCVFFGIAAWSMGNADLREMDDGLMDPSGRELTNAGRICGMIATGLMVLQILLLFIFVVPIFLSSRP